MNPIDDQLNRLFRAARKPDAGEFVAPFGMDTRVVAAWRTGRLENGAWDVGLLARGLAVAIFIMGASFWPVLHKTTTDPLSEYLQTSDTTLAAVETP